MTLAFALTFLLILTLTLALGCAVPQQLRVADNAAAAELDGGALVHF